MKILTSIIGFCLLVSTALAQDRATYAPVPEHISAPSGGAPPSDAIVLFDGSGLDAWSRTADGEAARWRIDGDAMTVERGMGTIRSKQNFGDMQLHVEWRPSDVIEGSGQSRGNSGVFLHGLFELQVLDSWDNDTYVNGQAASIYLQEAPRVNVARAPGQWQSYDIIFTAPKWQGDELLSPAYLTVLHNGVLVHNHVEIQGSTFTPQPEYRAHCGLYSSEERLQDCTDKLPIILQDHGQVVSFRNIWVREL